MARISTYQLDEKVTGGDKWIGSDSGFYNKTKNFTPLKLADYFNSSEKIDSTNSLRFWYQTLDFQEDRSFGTISFENEIGASVSFSSITSFLLSKRTEGNIFVYDFLSSLIDSKVLLHQGNTMNLYAIYEVTNIEEYELDSNFIKVDVSFIRGNGSLIEDLSYLLSVVDFALEASLNWGNIEGNLSDQTDLQEALDLKADISSLGDVAFSNDYNDLDNNPTIPTNTSDLINDGEDGINPFITLNDIPNPPTPTLESVLAESNETNGYNIVISNGDEITFDNGSRIRKGLTDSGNGGAKGVALVCSLDYELKWEAGRQYVMQQDGFTIREVSHNFTIVPTAIDDDTKGFVVGSRWILDNGDVYECTDASTANATWELTTIDLSGYVPYTGATTNVDLGEFELKAGQLTLDTSPTGTAAVGTTRWNNTLGSSETTLKGGSVILKNGVDLVARVVNKVTPNTTLTKANYAAVRVSGAQGQRLAVAYAQANNDLNSADTIGLVCETIPTNQEGFILTVGQLENINTTGNLQGENWNDGDVIYLSPTVAGKLTNIKPTAPQHIVIIGYVEYAHANNGKLYVKIMNGWELEELHNVTSTNYTTPIDTDSVLTYDVTNSLWKRLSWLNIKSNLKTYFDTIYQAALGFTPENVANKSTNLTSPDNTKYPTTQAVVDGLATKQNTLTNPITGTGANGQVAFFNGTTTQTGDNVLFWDNTNKRLGVGTNAPTRTLQVSGVTFISAAAQGNTSTEDSAPLIVQNTLPYASPFNQFLQIWRNSSGTTILSLRADGSFNLNGTVNTNNLSASNNGNGTTSLTFARSNNGFWFPDGNKIGFNTNGSEKMRITDTGQVTIGATTAGARLDVRAQGALSTDIAFRVRNSADTADLMSVNGLGTTTIGNTTNGNVALNVRGNIVANSNSSANITLGTNASNQPIISGYGNGLNIVTVHEFAAGNARILLQPLVNNNIVNTVTGTGVLLYNTGGSERMRITNTGNVGIGASAPVASAQLQVDSTTRGFLPPRMTTTERNAIATPAAGLIVYDTTDNKHYGYNGTTWNAFY